MKLFFDARFVRFPRHDGISRYSAELVTALGKMTDVTMIIHDQRQLKMLPNLPYVKLNSPLSPREVFIAKKLNKLSAEVVFCPMQTMGSFGRSYRLILTLHDLIYYFYPAPPRNLPLPVRLAWRLFHLAYWPQRFLLGRADMVVTVSQSTKDLIQKYHLTRRPIRVVYNAPLEITSTSTQKRTKNLLYMGSFLPYKNLETLIQALFYLPGYSLHCLSSVTLGDKRRFTALAPPHQIVFHSGVSDSVYSELLGSAHALISPSKIEGFNLPIIEAMQAGLPVVCSDIAVHREVAGPAALFFETNNPTSLSKKVLRLEDKKARTDIITAGRKQAQKFNWQKSAAALLSAVKSLEA